MTYENFKLFIFYMALHGPNSFPAISAALKAVWNRDNDDANAEVLTKLAYDEYCRTHGITE